MPRITLQEKTEDTLIEHTIEMNKYASSQAAEVNKEINKLLLLIRKSLLDGPKHISMIDLRNMIRDAKKLFKAGYKVISNKTNDDINELLLLELEGQTKVMQELINEYDIPYDVREPSFVLAKRKLKDLPIKDQTFATWFSVWETKIIGKMSSSLFSEYTGEITRSDLVGEVFGTDKEPFTFNTFSRANADMTGLFISLIDGIQSISTTSLVESNQSIIIGQRYNSCLCATTCPSCSSLHGAIRYFNGVDETDGNEIPLHPNCMCNWIPVYRKPSSMSVKVPLNARTAINSNESPKKFPVWYNSISTQRKIDLFGKTRYQMLEAGDITVGQLLTKKNRRVYTLQELQNKGYRIPEK